MGRPNERRGIDPETGLSTQQMRFLGVRLTVQTDKEAALKVGLREELPARWKKEQPEFRAAYEAIWHDGVELAKAYARKLLGQSVSTLEDALEAQGTEAPDWRARLDAAKTLLTIHGVLRTRVDVTVIRQEAERLAAQYGLDADELIAEADEIVRGKAPA